ncbi:glycosyltransferase family 2 protein [Rhodococcus sp. NPDC003348]
MVRKGDILVSVGLPVRDGAGRMSDVVESVLAQDHANLELVISDNASSDGTEDLCRSLAAHDSRVVYRRNPVNVGILNNFTNTLRLATGTYFRWVSDDDWLHPHCISRALDIFTADDRLVLVTNEIEYRGEDGVPRIAAYNGAALGSSDPVARFAEYLRLLTDENLQIDPLYGTLRRESVLHIGRRNMLREDEVYATKLALAGPWGHVPEVLTRRIWKYENMSVLARRLDVPPWQAHFATLLQCREMLQWLTQCDLTEQQRRTARLAVAQMYTRRQRISAARRGRKVVRVARDLVPPLLTARGTHQSPHG